MIIKDMHVTSQVGSHKAVISLNQELVSTCYSNIYHALSESILANFS